jgi:hypothetical protein
MYGGSLCKGHWGFPAKGGVFAVRAIESVDVFEESHFDFATGLPVSTPDQFGFP